ncbi:MAG: nitrilase-related carbon-nitrogen hydrolase [Gemmatimonadota bacterium]
MAQLRVALGQYDTAWEDPRTSLQRAGQVIERAAAAGAQLVALPETSTTGFTMESERFAEPLDGNSVTVLADLASRHNVHVLAGVATREEGGFHNSALLFAPTGELIAHYRKQRLFALGGEDASYQPGAEAVIADIDGVRIAPFICYDLRFPELFRAVAPQVDAMILIANWPQRRRAHWDVLVQARAIENQCYFVAVNRVGTASGTPHDGGSVIYGPWGESLAEANDADAATSAVSMATIDTDEVTRVRTRYPFVQDCRNEYVL